VLRCQRQLERREAPIEAHDLEPARCSYQRLGEPPRDRSIRACAQSDVEQHQRLRMDRTQARREPRGLDIQPLGLGERPDHGMHHLTSDAVEHGRCAAVGQHDFAVETHSSAAPPSF
jgi:hypothetical protein